MNRIPARYYDGRTSVPREVEVEALPRPGGRVQLRVHGVAPDEVLDFDNLPLEARVGAAARIFELPGGATLEIAADGPGVQGAAPALGHGWVHALESRWPIALAAVIVTIGTFWATMQYGVPALARRAVHLIPPSVDDQVGLGGLELLDKQYFRPTRLPPERQKELQAEFDAMVRDLGQPGSARLALRDGGPLGANAFALPSGIVVVTDQLVGMVKHDDELRAVLAHELGHVEGRHSMRMLLQSSTNAILMVGLLGDVSAASSLTASVPTVLVQAANSRDFEREADAYAKAWMHRQGIPVSRMGDLLTRLEQRYGQDSWGYLSTHPPLAERLKD